MSMLSTPLRPHPDLDGITLEFKGVAFALLDQDGKSRLFAHTESGKST